MTTLAANVPSVYSLGDYTQIPVIAADIIYTGAAVGENGAGYARPLVAGDRFLGFAKEQADNATGAAGAVSITVDAKASPRTCGSQPRISALPRAPSAA